MTIVGRDKVSVSAGTTPRGGEIKIETTPTGLYQIVFLGEGAPPAITQELFTSLPFARRAIEQWRLARTTDYNKEAHKTQMIARRKKAHELKNGELDDTVNGEEDE